MSIDELTPDERAALAAERDGGAPDPRMEERMLRRLQIAIAVGGASPSSPPGAGAGSARTRPIAPRTVTAAAIGALLGAGVTALTTHRTDPAHVRIERTEVEAAAPPPAPSPEDSGSRGAPPAKAAPSPVAPTGAPAAPSSPRPRGSSSPSSADTLGAETNLLDAARTALGRGDGEAALRVLDEHARRFPASSLREEREALIVPALMLAHRPAEAAAKAKSFRDRFPRSIFLPSVDAALHEKE